MIGNHARHRGKHTRHHIEPYKISEFVVAYLVGLVVWSISVAVSAELHIPLSLVTHLLVGFFLTRFISHRVVWNWYLTSIADIAKSKWATFIGWQLALPVLIWQLVIYKYL
jgi:hypothetical protein